LKDLTGEDQESEHTKMKTFLGDSVCS